MKDFIDKNPSAPHLLFAMFAMGSQITKTCATEYVNACAKTWDTTKTLDGAQTVDFLKQMSTEINEIGMKHVEVSGV